MEIVKEPMPKRRSGFYYDLPFQDAEMGYPSVTTILRVLAKPELDRWKAQLVARRAVETMDVNEAVLAPLKVMRTAGDEGSIAHELIDNYWKGTEYDKTSQPEKVIQYLGAFESFIQDFQPKVIESEGLVYSNKEKYAGTFDGIFEIKNQRWLIDWKTSNGIYWEHRLQLVAYYKALKEMGHKIDRMAIVQLKNNGTYDLVNVAEIENNNDNPVNLYKAFLSAKMLFDTKEVLRNL